MSLKRSASPQVEDDAKRKAKPAYTPRMVTTLATTMSLSNIDLALPDEPRPFKVVNTIPLSTETPVYDERLGTSLLGVKDSATLYNSLIISRQNWLYNDQMGVFKQYWSRREDWMEKAHGHEQEEGVKQEEPDESRTEFGDGDDEEEFSLASSKRKNMSKLCECVLQLGPHSFDVRLFIIKDEEVERRYFEEQKANTRAAKKAAKEAAMSTGGFQMEGGVGAAAGAAAAPDKDEDDGDDDDGNDKSRKASDDEEDEDEDAEKDGKNGTSQQPAGPKAPTIVTVKQEEPGKTAIRTPPPKAQPQSAKAAAQERKEAEVKQIKNIADSGKQAAESKGKRPEIPQSLENHIMISNLNQLARQNKSLNELMKTVASGSANNKQIDEFQKFILEAKKMGDPKGSLERSYHAQVKAQREAERDAKQKEKEQKAEEKRQQQLERQRQRELKKEQKAAERQREKELKKEQREIRKALKQKERLKNPQKAKKAKKIVKTKLTALQERYVDNATLSFEFAENSSARYYLPKNCIMESLGNGEVLVSFVVVHNQAEIKAYEDEVVRVETAKAEAAKDAAEKKLEEEKPKETVAPRRRRVSRLSLSRKSSHRPAKVEEAEPEPELVRPLPVYSTLTVKLYEVPAHCIPLILNSPDPVADVQQEMQTVLEEGVRQEVDFVWYQLDGVKDEILAEQLRHNLQTLEAANVKRTGGGGRKRNSED